jgi:hypothetical protein
VDALLLWAFLNLDVGNRIRIKETQSGTDDNYFINGIEFAIDVNGIITFSYVLSKLDEFTSEYIDSYVPVNWFAPAGVDINTCVAAYQAKGAASYADSLTNLAHPGSYTLTSTSASAPDWTSDSGWHFDGSTQALNTGIVPTTEGTWIIRFSGATAQASAVFGLYMSGSATVFFTPKDLSGNRVWGNGKSYAWDSAPTDFASGVAAAGELAFWNGEYVFSFPHTNTPTLTTVTMALGGCNVTNPFPPKAPHFWAGYIQAFAYYNTELTPSQIQAITDEMSKL